MQEKVFHLQQSPSDIYHRTLSMSPLYLGKLKSFKSAANLGNNANKMR